MPDLPRTFGAAHGRRTAAVVPHRRTALRPTWDSLPRAVRAAIEARTGAPVLRARSQDGGFTEGFASRLELSDGRRLFVKAAPEDGYAHPAYRQEARVVRGLPDAVAAPRLQWTLDAGDWVVLAFEDVEGATPQRPWDADELASVLRALEQLAAAMTPAPDALLPLASTADLDPELRF